MHLDLVAFEPSADGQMYCLVAAITVEVDKEAKLMPIFIPMLKKDAVSGLAAVKEAFTLRNDRNVHEVTGSQKLKDLCFDKNITLSFLLVHQPSSNGIAERMVGMLKTTVRRLPKQAHLDRQWWSYVQVCGTYDEREDPWPRLDTSTIRSISRHLERT